MELNNLQPNNTYNASFTPNTAYGAGKQEAQPQARPVPPLGSAADLSANPSARNLQEYSASSTPQGATDPWTWQEYQPIQPGEPYMEKLADEAMKTKKAEMLLKHAREYEELGDFKDAEKAYKKALKHTEDAEHYKLYAACLKQIYLNLASASSKDEAQEKTYKEKAARAFYYLGELHKKQAAWKEAQTAYKASCDLAFYEAPLQVLVDVARQLEDTTDIAAALEKLADFYVEKGKIDLAVDQLKEAFEIGKAARILEKLEVLYRQEGGEDALEKLADFYAEKGAIALAIDKLKEAFEVRKAAKILEKLEVLYRQEGGEDALEKLADFYAEKGAIGLAIDKLKEVLESRKSAKILEKLEALYRQEGGKNSQSQMHEVAIQRFELQLSQDQKNIGLYRKYAWFLKDIGKRNEARAIKERMDELQAVESKLLRKLEQKVVKQKIKIGDLKRTIHSQAGKIHHLQENVQVNASNNDTAYTAIGSLLTRVKAFETVKLPEQANSIRTVNTQLENLGCHVKCLEEQVTILALSLKDIDLEPILSKNPYIKSLNLTRCKLVTDNAFRHIDKWPQLTSLNLTGCKLITDDALRYIGTCTQLTSLNLTGCKLITDDAFRYIGTRTQLTSLTFSGCNQVTDETFRYIGEFSQLTSLSFSNCTKVTDDAFRYIGEFSQLTSLSFSNCTKVTDDAFRYIGKCSQLTSLAFSNCTQATDYALLIIKFLGFTQLTSLTLRGCYKITSDAREQLKKQIPGVTIHG